jgi:hypothetical protein
MEKMIKSRRQKKIVLFVIFSAAILISLKFLSDFKMPSPLVYLVPDTYVGPVFVFFGQKDGIELKTDPLGKSVTVPDNGIIKIKQPMASVVGESNSGRQNIYFIRVSKNGGRKAIKIVSNTQRDNDGELFEVYYDEQGKGHKFLIDKNSKPFYYFSEDEKNEKMIFAHEGCQNQLFIPDNSPNMEPPDCGKFLVMSPNQFLIKPDWVWEDLQHPYSSIDQLIQEADEIKKRKSELIKQ